MPYFINYATSNRTRCSCCKNQILLHEFRLIYEYGGFHGYKNRSYYCKKCAKKYLIEHTRQSKEFIEKVKNAIKKQPIIKSSIILKNKCKKENLQYKFKNCIDKR